MEELGQLIIAIVFILFYVLTGSKKRKKQVPPAARRQPPQVPPPVAMPPEAVDEGDTRPEAQVALDEWEDPAEVPEKSEQQVERKRSLAEELFAMLQDQAPPKSVDVVFESQVDDEARSLEVLEPFSLEPSEKVLHDVPEEEPPASPYAVEEMPADRPYAIDDTPEERPYLVEAPKDPEPYEITDERKRKKHLTRSELRHAFVMREVLGPPKALEE